MMTISKREKRLLFLALIILPLLFSLKYLIIPSIDEYFLIEKQLQEFEYKLEMDNIKLQSVDRYIEQIEGLDLELEKIEKRFYSGQVETIRIEILKELDKLIRKSNLKAERKELNIEELDLDNDDNGDRFLSARTGVAIDEIEEAFYEKFRLYRFRYQLQLEGTMEELLLFLESLSQQQKFYNLYQMDLRRSASENSLIIMLIVDSYSIGDDITYD